MNPISPIRFVRPDLFDPISSIRLVQSDSTIVTDKRGEEGWREAGRGGGGGEVGLQHHETEQIATTVERNIAKRHQHDETNSEGLGAF